MRTLPLLRYRTWKRSELSRNHEPKPTWKIQSFRFLNTQRGRGEACAVPVHDSPSNAREAQRPSQGGPKQPSQSPSRKMPFRPVRLYIVEYAPLISINHPSAFLFLLLGMSSFNFPTPTSKEPQPAPSSKKENNKSHSTKSPLPPLPSHTFSTHAYTSPVTNPPATQTAEYPAAPT